MNYSNSLVDSQSTDNFSYVLVKNGPDYAPEETQKLQYTISIVWNNNIIHCSHLSSNQSFCVGETIDCNYYLPFEKINSEKLTIINNNTLFAPNQPPTKIQINNNYQFTISDFTFQITADYSAKPISHNFTFNKVAVIFTAASLLTHAILLGSTAWLMPDFESNDSEISVEQQLLMSQYLASAAEKEQKIEEVTTDTSNYSQGGTGSRAKGLEGLMGDPLKSTNGRYALAGPKENVDPHLAKQKLLQDATNFGLVGILSSYSGGDPNAPTAIWGRDDSLGNDAVSANGSLWGNQIGESFGAGGLSLTGIGESGAGNAEGIGLGRINTLGHGDGTGLDQGFGPGTKLSNSHRTTTPKLRVGATNTSGKIPPEVIQRIVRQNFGRFKTCYQMGLKNNPSLTGRVTARFVIDRNGVASQASNGGSDLPDNSVVSCVTSCFNNLSFPAPENGIVTVSYSIQFSPE